MQNRVKILSMILAQRVLSNNIILNKHNTMNERLKPALLSLKMVPREVSLQSSNAAIEFHLQ